MEYLENLKNAVRVGQVRNLDFVRRVAVGYTKCNHPVDFFKRSNSMGSDAWRDIKPSIQYRLWRPARLTLTESTTRM